MASIVKRPNGCREIRITFSDGSRPVVRLGRCDQKTANGVLVHVERMAAAVINGTTPPADTLGWLNTVSDTLRDRLARAGLCSARSTHDESRALGLRNAFDTYLARRIDWQPGTALVFEQARKHLTAYFGDTRSMDTISVGEAKDFRRHMAAEYSEAYISKMIRQARQLWRDAVDRKLIAENPWSSVRLGSDRNPARQRYIGRTTIDKVIAGAQCQEWQLLIALARYGGLRMPSEPLALRWKDIDLDNGRMTVTSSKTRRYAGRDVRVVPIFPQLRPYLQAAREAQGRDAVPADAWVISRYRQTNANLRTQFLRIIERAGVTKWPRLFQNLRASCETDWVERFPAHVVCAWIGHSEVVARNHYLQVTEAHFQAAITVGDRLPSARSS